MEGCIVVVTVCTLIFTVINFVYILNRYEKLKELSERLDRLIKDNESQKKSLRASPVKIKEELPPFAVWKPSVETYAGYKIPVHPTNWHCSNCGYELCNVNGEPDISTCPNCHVRMVFDSTRKE